VSHPTLSIETYRDFVGRELGASRWFELGQDKIDAFGHVTEDRQYIHVDPVAAAASPFGGAIAHGFLTLSMLSAMSFDALPNIEGAKMGVNYGFNSIRFLAPVPSGKRVRGRFVLKDLKERSSGQWQSTFDVTVEIEGATKPAVVAEWITITAL
jgi:acyl dehydratase